MGAVQLHAVEPRLHGAACGLTKQVDDAGQFVVAQSARHLVGLLAVGGVDETLDGALSTADRLHSAVKTGVGRTPWVPDLQLHASAGSVDRLRDPAPAGHAGLVEDPGLAREGTAVGGHHGGLGNQQSGRCPLRVVLGHQGVGDVAAAGTGARQGRHQDAVGQRQRTELQGIEE